jgi:hypothetical protein
MGKYSIYTRRIIRVNVDMMWAYVDKKVCGGFL